MSRLLVTGDTHRTVDIKKLIKLANTYKLTKEDYVVILGDFGAIWETYGSKENEEYLQVYEDMPWTTLWIDGNHENFDAIEQYPVEDWNGGKIHRVSPTVIHLMRGQVFTICDKKIFTMGGGTSIDKHLRQNHISWWKQEIPNTKEFNTAIDNLKANDNKVDLIFTHSCSRDIERKIYGGNLKYPDELNGFFEFLKEDIKVEYKHWYFGHHHIDKDIDEKHTCLYNTFREIM